MTGRTHGSRLIRIAVLVAAITLFASGMATPTNALPTSQPNGGIACADVNALLKFGPALKAIPSAHTVTLQGVADSCNIGSVTGGKAPIGSLKISATAKNATVSCDDLTSPTALTMKVTITYVDGINGNGAKISSSTAEGQFVIGTSTLDATVGSGGFASAPVHLSGGMVGLSGLAALCASPYGIPSVPIAGNVTVGTVVEPPLDLPPALTGFTVAAPRAVGCIGDPTGLVTLDKASPADTFVAINSGDPGSLTVVGGGATVPAGLTTGVFFTNAITESSAVTLSATLGVTTHTAAIAVGPPSESCPGLTPA